VMMFDILQHFNRSLPPTPTPGRWGCFPLPSERGSRAILPGGCIPVSRTITPRSSPKPAWGSISWGGIPGCCISASSTWTTSPAGWCCIPCWGITRCITDNHCQGNSKLQHALDPLVKSSCLFDLQINLAMSISVAFAHAS